MKKPFVLKDLANHCKMSQVITTMEKALKINCYLSLNCTSEGALRENMKRALELEAPEAEVNFHRINEAEAKRLGLMGSPSILINGIEILPADIPSFS